MGPTCQLEYISILFFLVTFLSPSHVSPVILFHRTATMPMSRTCSALCAIACSSPPRANACSLLPLPRPPRLQPCLPAALVSQARSHGRRRSPVPRLLSNERRPCADPRLFCPTALCCTPAVTVSQRCSKSWLCVPSCSA